LWDFLWNKFTFFISIFFFSRHLYFITKNVVCVLINSFVVINYKRKWKLIYYWFNYFCIINYIKMAFTKWNKRIASRKNKIK
jgi:hypothetical protein